MSAVTAAMRREGYAIIATIGDHGKMIAARNVPATDPLIDRAATDRRYNVTMIAPEGEKGYPTR